jgi:uncharacterized membrane protein
LTKAADRLLEDVRKVSPQVADAREVAALIESFGYNDRSMKELGFPDVFSLAEHLFVRFPREAVIEAQTPRITHRQRLWTELAAMARKCSLSAAYAVPWFALLVFQYKFPDALKVSPELGGAMSLSLIASLVATGGFVQMISRSGSFHYSMEQPFLARHSCIQLLILGTVSTLLLASLGIAIGTYFQVFAIGYLILAALNYICLSLLWMLYAMIAVQGIGWCIPLIFLVSAAGTVALSLFTNVSSTALLMLWPPIAVLCSIPCAVVGFKNLERRHPGTRDSIGPRFGISMLSLLPFYLYGTVYFGFMFADRLSAGSAIPWVYGLSFGINSAYTRGMDTVLLAFLITAALAEYFSDAFLRSWNGLAKQVSQANSHELSRRLQKRHALVVMGIAAVFLAACAVSWGLFLRWFGMLPSRELLVTALIGGLGYLMLSVALFENIVLASMNANSLALRSVALGLAVNLAAGYSLSHLFGVQYAAVGLLTGSLILVWKSNRAVRHALRHPDYHYSVA